MIRERQPLPENRAMEKLESIRQGMSPQKVMNMAQEAEADGRSLHAATFLSRAVHQQILQPHEVTEHLLRYADNEAGERRMANVASILGLGAEMGAFTPEHADPFQRHIQAAAGEENGKRTVVASSIMAHGVKAGILNAADHRDALIRFAKRRAELGLFHDAYNILRNGVRSSILTPRHAKVFEAIAKMADQSSTQKRTAESIRTTMQELKSQKK